MRIALFTETFIPKVDGIVTTLCQTVKQLNSLGHEVLIFAPDGGFDHFDQSRIIGMKSSSFPLYPELRLSFPRASMRRAMIEFQPDIIHVVEPALLGTAGLYYGGGANGGALRLPLVISYHTDLPKYLHYYHLSFMEPYVWSILRFRHKRGTINLCTSVTMVREFKEHGISRVALWPGGVDADLFHPEQRSMAMRERLTQGHPECPLLLCVGRLSAEKDLESLKPLLQAIPNARLALIGDGPHHKALEQHFAGCPVYMPGFMHGEELAQAYASSDIFVMPSRTETLGLVVIEAMSSGLPVVAARAGGIPELIEDGVSGYLFDQGSQALEAVQGLLGSPEKMQAIGKAAREHASHLSWKAATCQLLQQYEKARREQHITVGPDPQPAHPSLRYRAKKMARNATLFTLRKMFP